jgi:malonate decarboxylase beta subunit
VVAGGGDVSGRGAAWTHALAAGDIQRVDGAVLAADCHLGGDVARLLCVVEDPTSPYLRARHGEVGVRESLLLAGAVRTATADRMPLVAVVDVPSQAYGRLEETVGIHLAVAAAVDAYAAARRAGLPVVALIVGSAISGGFLAHGLMAGHIVALDAPGVEVQAMNRRTAARITRRSVAELEHLGTLLAPLSYEVARWATLGQCDRLVAVSDPAAPTGTDVDRIREALVAGIGQARRAPHELLSRLDVTAAATVRAASIRARARIRDQWS